MDEKKSEAGTSGNIAVAMKSGETSLPSGHGRQRNSSPSNKNDDSRNRNSKTVPKTSPKTTAIGGAMGKSRNGDFHRKAESSIKKASDSDNIVTVATTSETRNLSSSSECQDTNQTTTTTPSSGSGGDDDVKPRPNREQNENTIVAKKSRDGLSLKKKARHHHPDADRKRSWNYTAGLKNSSLNDDGSTLQVPGDDGSDRIVAGDIEGGVPIKPATVVASRLFTPHTPGTDNCRSSCSTFDIGSEHKSSSEISAHNQHHLLLPPHREPRYHTIRNTLYRFQSSDSNGSRKKYSHRKNRSKKRRRGSVDKKKTFAKRNKHNTDPSSTDETPKETSADKDHRGDRSSSSSSSTRTQNDKLKGNGKQVRPSRSSATTASTNTGSVKSKTSSLASPNSSIQEGNTGGSSSGSGTDGTEDGYAGSVSSNENGSGNHQLGSSSPSPSVTSSEECEQRGGGHKAKRHRRANSSKHKSSQNAREQNHPESSSEIADFGSSGSSETMDEADVGNGRTGGNTQTFEMKAFSSSTSPSLSSSNYSDSDGLEMAYLSAKRDADAEHERMLKIISRKKKAKNATIRGSMAKSLASRVTSSKRLASKDLEGGHPPILAMGCDVMAHILTFLHPPEILDVLTMPLSKCWRRNFTSQPELWRVLCLVEPFKAIMDDPDRAAVKIGTDSLSDGSDNSTKTGKVTEKLLDKYRLLYTSFVRCMKYVSQIRDDAINGRPPAYIDYGISGAVSDPPDIQTGGNTNKMTSRVSSSPPPPTTLGSNRNLQLFLAQARDVVMNSSHDDDVNLGGESKSDDTPRGLTIFPTLTSVARVGTAHRKSERTKKRANQEKNNGPKFGRSMITKRLFGAVPGSEPSNLNLPWSCAIYSIVNWMVAFSDVEGIQTLCLKVLPVLLENEQHRLTAQHAGLADVVLRAMVMFSESSTLHIAAFHTIVLLARPHGGREGMMFRTSMTADGIFRGIYQRHGKSGIAVMLDSMRRFQDNATLLAMSCWALVNIALVSDQKAVLVKLGGIQAITNAMYRHPFSAELQFRALFALINLVIPSVKNVENGGDGNNINGNENGDEHSNLVAAPPSEPEQLGELNDTTEKEIIDELVGDIASLVVHVMKNFCSSEAILNRACLVLHNLSLTDDYHVTLLWTPQCYQMLEWCVANFRSDQVLQQSATGTLHRLKSTLASNEEMRSRFSKTLQSQQQHVTLKRNQRELR